MFKILRFWLKKFLGFLGFKIKIVFVNFLLMFHFKFKIHNYKTQKFWTLSETQLNRLDTQKSDFVHWSAILNIKHYFVLDNVYGNHMRCVTFHLRIMFINQVRSGQIIMFTFLLCVTINIVKQICLGTAHNVMERSEMELWAVPRLVILVSIGYKNEPA